jgi:hypothetical protein
MGQERRGAVIMAKDEYKVQMKDERGRKSFTLVNSTSASAAAAKAKAETRHAGKTVTSTKKTGRSF